LVSGEFQVESNFQYRLTLFEDWERMFFKEHVRNSLVEELK